MEIVFDHLDRHKHENSHTLYLAYEGPLPRSHAQTIKVDITISEQIVLPLELRVVLHGYDEYSDLPEDKPIYAYSLGEIATEKTVALLDRARNEPRDLYDLWYLTAGGHVYVPDLLDPIVRKLEFRGWTLELVDKEIRAKEARYEKLWQARLAAQMAELPPFDNVYRAVRRALRQIGIS